MWFLLLRLMLVKNNVQIPGYITLPVLPGWFQVWSFPLGLWRISTLQTGLWFHTQNTSRSIWGSSVGERKRERLFNSFYLNHDFSSFLWKQFLLPLVTGTGQEPNAYRKQEVSPLLTLFRIWWSNVKGQGHSDLKMFCLVNAISLERLQRTLSHLAEKFNWTWMCFSQRSNVKVAVVCFCWTWS